MGNAAKKLYSEACQLPPLERIELVDEILASLDEPNEKIDQLWVKEAEDRISA